MSINVTVNVRSNGWPRKSGVGASLCREARQSAIQARFDRCLKARQKDPSLEMVGLDTRVQSCVVLGFLSRGPTKKKTCLENNALKKTFVWHNSIQGPTGCRVHASLIATPQRTPQAGLAGRPRHGGSANPKPETNLAGRGSKLGRSQAARECVRPRKKRKGREDNSNVRFQRRRKNKLT
ncbi:hypothetical protein BC827DRAFT_491311 [Russula dissimulans]|nr:hypothetical protein BC827DRAFT_491311 [Russula dissimulans]